VVTVSDTKLAEHILAPFAVFTNFGSNLNGIGPEDDAEGFSNSCKSSIQTQTSTAAHTQEILLSFSSGRP